MDKSDGYFLVATILALPSFIEIAGRARRKIPATGVLPALRSAAVIGSLVLCGLGWYRLHHIDRLHFGVRQD